MQQVIKYLNIVVIYLELARSIVGNLDNNTTGKDDDFARFLDSIIKQIRAFIEIQPQQTLAARGYTQTLAFCNDVLSKLDLLANSDLDKATKKAQMKEIAETLENPNLVWQAKSGNDAEVLSQTKIKASEKISKI